MSEYFRLTDVEISGEKFIMYVSDQLFTDKNTQDWLKFLLRQENVTVEFKKSDGSIRSMLCTLNESKIPVEKSPKNSGRRQNDEILAVFDVEKQDWRSFRWDSIVSLEFNFDEWEKK